MMEYVIVKVSFPEHLATLVKKVQEKIEEGFEPLGGMTTWVDKLNGPCFAQTMLKHAESDQELQFVETVDPYTGKPYEDGVGW